MLFPCICCLLPSAVGLVCDRSCLSHVKEIQPNDDLPKHDWLHSHKVDEIFRRFHLRLHHQCVICSKQPLSLNPWSLNISVYIISCIHDASQQVVRRPVYAAAISECETRTTDILEWLQSSWGQPGNSWWLGTGSQLCAFSDKFESSWWWVGSSLWTLMDHSYPINLY